MEAKNILIIGVIIVSLVTSAIVINYLGIDSFYPNTRDSGDYVFIWDEFADAPGYLKADDSLVFGPSMGPFHNYTELETKLKSLAKNFPEIIELVSIGKSYQGREIYAIKLTDESRSPDYKAEILIVAQHHAREQVTRENALFFLDKMANDYIQGNNDIKEILKTREIYIIPSLNPDGSEYLSINPWQRKTMRPIDDDNDGTLEDELEVQDIDGNNYVDTYYINTNGDGFELYGYEGIDIDKDGKTGEDMPGGVDPNRNYGVEFANLIGASNEPISEAFHGPEAFSENCTARFRDFVLDHKFKTAISLHSGIKKLLGPWAWSGNLPKGEIGEFYQTIADEFSFITDIEYSSLYKVTGEWGDWMFSLDNTLVEFTLEVYGNSAALASEYNATSKINREWGVWDLFNPPADKVMENSENIYKGLKYLVEEGQFVKPKPAPRASFPVSVFFVALVLIGFRIKKRSF